MAKKFDLVPPSYLELDIPHSVHSNTRSFIQQSEKIWNNTSSSISVLHTSSILYLTQTEYEILVEILEQIPVVPKLLVSNARTGTDGGVSDG